MTELRQCMLDAMVQRGFALRTQEAYVRAIRRMAKFYRRDPAQYTAQEVRACLLHMVKDEKLSYSSMNQAACAAQFLFQTVLGHGREQFHIPFAKVPAKQPELLARGEIARLLTACLHSAKRMLLQTIYATGLWPRGARRGRAAPGYWAGRSEPSHGDGLPQRNVSKTGQTVTD